MGPFIRRYINAFRGNARDAGLRRQPWWTDWNVQPEAQADAWDRSGEIYDAEEPRFARGLPGGRPGAWRKWNASKSLRWAIPLRRKRGSRDAAFISLADRNRRRHSASRSDGGAMKLGDFRGVPGAPAPLP